MGGSRAQKADYFEKLRGLLSQYKSIFIVGYFRNRLTGTDILSVDNVGSNQMHQIRQALRGDAVILLGKNTMIRRAIRGYLNEFPDHERLLPYVKGNVGFVFTNKELKDIREKITANRVAAPARAGAIAPLDVFVPAINTGLDPSKTSFFQGIPFPPFSFCFVVVTNK
jgi:large subunit ribosomal protein LP0